MSTKLRLRDVVPDYFPERLKKVSKKIREDKEKINNIVQEFNSEHKDEILESTKKKQKLLSEGLSRGLSEEEAQRYIAEQSGFLPSVYTPTLNWLFWFMENYDNNQKEEERQQLNENIGHLTHDEVNVMENTPELFEYLYGNISLELFSKLKKLKALSRSSNENEAFSAYRKCMSLCNEHRIDFDKIPIVK